MSVRLLGIPMVKEEDPVKLEVGPMKARLPPTRMSQPLNGALAASVPQTKSNGTSGAALLTDMAKVLEPKTGNPTDPMLGVAAVGREQPEP